MVETVGSRVKKLKRIRVENIELASLGVGEIKHLGRGELRILFEKLDIPQIPSEEVIL